MECYYHKLSRVEHRKQTYPNEKDVTKKNVLRAHVVNDDDINHERKSRRQCDDAYLSAVLIHEASQTVRL